MIDLAAIEAKIDRLIEMLENPKPYVPACLPGCSHSFVACKGYRCWHCDADGREILAWGARQEAQEAERKERDLYTLSYQLGVPKAGQEHVSFCTLPPDHPPGCGVTASGAMHPDSDAAKRYREMRGGASQEKPGNQSNGWRR